MRFGWPRSRCLWSGQALSHLAEMPASAFQSQPLTSASHPRCYSFLPLHPPGIWGRVGTAPALGKSVPEASSPLPRWLLALRPGRDQERAQAQQKGGLKPHPVRITLEIMAPEGGNMIDVFKYLKN